MSASSSSIAASPSKARSEALTPLVVERVSLRGFRNLTALDLEASPRFNVLAGDNGQGKTNLLEALYLGGTTKSFRTAKLGELVGHDAAIASVRLSVREGEGDHATRREQVVGLDGGTRSVKIDGKRPPSLAAYAVHTPVVVFHPGEVALSQGPSGERRRLLDRVALYREPASLADAESYARAIRERQRALEMRGTAARDLEEWELLAVRHGLALMEARRRAGDALAASAEQAFLRIAAPDLRLHAAYVPSAPEDEDAFRRELALARSADLRKGSATVGPHRDELELSVNGHVARSTASQGQHRALVLALKVAEIDVIGRARGVRPVLLLDDVSSELDRERTAALMTFLHELEGQVFLTTTRPELIDTGTFREARDRLDWRVRNGTVEALL